MLSPSLVLVSILIFNEIDYLIVIVVVEEGCEKEVLRLAKIIDS